MKKGPGFERERLPVPDTPATGVIIGRDGKPLGKDFVVPSRRRWLGADGKPVQERVGRLIMPTPVKKS